MALELAWPAPPAPSPVRAPASAAPAEAARPEPVGAWAASVLARPLFSANRRPPASAAIAAPASPRTQPPRLSGIVRTAQGRLAIFDPVTPDGRATIAAEGAYLGPWRVERIGAESVDLSGPEGRRSVRPSFSGQAPAVAPAPPRSAAAPSLLPMVSPLDTRPFQATAQPSGASIFSNAPAATAARTPQ